MACSGATERPWPKRDGHRVELAPVARHQRLGAFRQLGAQPIELAKLAQEPFVVLDAELERHAGRCRRWRSRWKISGTVSTRFWAWEIMNGELAVLQRGARIEGIAQADLAGVERHAEREQFEGRAHLEHAVVRRLIRVGSSASRGLLAL